MVRNWKPPASLPLHGTCAQAAQSPQGEINIDFIAAVTPAAIKCMNKSKRKSGNEIIVCNLKISAFIVIQYIPARLTIVPK